MLKLIKIITKNYKVLLRSKSSALVVILGPLLIILLVGIAFSSSSTFTLNIGVFSPDYNELTESYIEKLSTENYKISRYYSNQECIDGIKSSGVHTCIIFPADFEISNEKTNEIKFYIDQTKQNFVYAVVSTLTSSFTQRSSELSLGLTTNIVDVLSRTGATVIKKQGDDVTKAKDLADDVISTSKSMQKKLEDNAVEVSSVSDVSGDLEKEGKLLRNRITDLYNEGMDIVNLTQTVIDEGSFSNQTLVNKWEDELDELQDTDGDLWQAWNDSIAAKDKFINSSNKLTASVSTMLAAVEDAEEKKNEVIAELKNGLDMDMDELQDNLEDIDTAMTGILADISQIEVISAQNIVSPITTSIETVVAEKSQLDYLFPSLIVLLIMFISILLSSTLIIMEKNSKAYFRNFTTPTSDFVFILATFVTSIALMIVQILVVLVIAGIIFKTPFLQNFFSITLLIFLISSVFVLIGMAIGYMFNTEQTAMIGAISVGALILLTSDIILPIENMPVYVQNLARVSPFVMGSNTLRKVILFSAGFRDIKGGILGLSLTIVIISVLIFGIQQAMKAHFFAKFSRNRKSKILDRPENVNDIFKINDVIIKDEKELYRFIKRLHRHEFKKLVYRRTNRVADFAIEVLGDEKLSKKLLKMKTRWGVLKVIELYRPAQKTVEKKALVSKPEGEKTKTAKKNIAKKK